MEMEIMEMHDDVKRGAKSLREAWRNPPVAQSFCFPWTKLLICCCHAKWFLKSLDPDGKRIVSNVYMEVYTRSSMYYDLVVTRKDEGLYYFANALEIYESFVWITRKSTWGKYPARTCRMYMP